MNQRFYTAFGYVASAFSQMEADLRILIAGLAFRGDTITASAFLDGVHLRSSIEILRKLGRQRWEDGELLDETVSRLRKVCDKRNLFIHGLWNPRDFGEEGGHALVTDLRTTFEDRGSVRLWHHGQTASFSSGDFQNPLSEIDQISTRFQRLCKSLEEDDDGLELGYFGSIALHRPVSATFDPSGDIHPEPSE